MDAPQRFVAWMSAHVANDKKHRRTSYRYHPRSDAHSKRLCELVLEDLLAACPRLAEDEKARAVVGGTNVSHAFANGQTKTLDLAIGTLASELLPHAAPAAIVSKVIGTLRIAVEAKQCMTEHSKSKPRIFDELSSSHAIVHAGEPNAIACGIVVVNIAARYASPTRQLATGNLVYINHNQPQAARVIVEHVRKLQRRSRVGQVGFDALATIVIDCDNTGACLLHTSPPAPEPGEPDHYNTFISDISRAYVERFP